MNDAKNSAPEATNQVDHAEQEKAVVATEEKPRRLSIKTSLRAGKPSMLGES